MGATAPRAMRTALTRWLSASRVTAAAALATAISIAERGVKRSKESPLCAAGSGTSTAMSSTPRIFHRAASAVWVWSNTSPSSEIGLISSRTRNTKATSPPGPRPRSSARHTPATITAASASADTSSTVGSITVNHLWAPSWARYWRSTAASRRPRTAPV